MPIQTTSEKPSLTPGGIAATHPGAISRQGNFTTLLATLYDGSAPLTITGLLMLADTVLALLGLLIDRTTVDGAATWLKPLKFAISTGLFSLTLAFLLAQLQRTRRFAKFLGWLISLALITEIVLIDTQAARHTSSHFNNTTHLDSGIYAAMGLGIAVLFLSSILLFILSLFGRLSSRALGWVMRFGLAIALAGMSTGVLMTLPTPQQLAAAHNSQAASQTGSGARSRAGSRAGFRSAFMPRTGAHTVGAPDTGPAAGGHLPLTGWSADHGDLRIAHFLGLHAMQGLLLAWFLTRQKPQWPERRQFRLLAVVAFAFLIAFSLVLAQALRGQALLHPDAQTWTGWAIGLAAVAAASLWVAFSGTSPHTNPQPVLQ